jgi:ribonuclease P protein component
VFSRKALRRAVDRNRLRRRLREMLRAQRPRSAGVDLVVRLKRPLSPAEIPAALAEAHQLLHSALSRAGAADAASGAR